MNSTLRIPLFLFGIVLRVLCIISYSLFILHNVAAQTVSTPYFCGFETEAECQQWSFRKTSRVATGFAIGEAVKSTGDKAMYTSYDDGSSAGYMMTGPGYVSISYTKVTLNAGFHNLFFDYRIKTGADYADMRMMVSLVPATTNLLPFATAIGGTSFNKNATAGQLFLSDPADEYKRSGWSTKSAAFNVASAGDYYLVFLFKQQGISEAARYGACFPERIGVGVDNISLIQMPVYGDCDNVPENITATKQTDGVKVSWSASNGATGSTFDLMYYKINQPDSAAVVPDTVFGLTQNEYLLSYATVPYGVYSVKVRSSCASDASPWIIKTPVIVYGPSDYCLEYWDLDASSTKCTTGSFGYPFSNLRTIDYGPESRESYHTVHYDTAERDPVTDYQLKTVLEGHWASVRLGVGSEFGPNEGTPGGPSARLSSGITYVYRVPEDAELFLLHYAPVLQFASHHPEKDQTQIVVDVLDQYGALLDSRCLRSKFNSIRLKLDELAGAADPGWKIAHPAKGQYGASDPSSTDEIKWHDWMTLGFNLKAYAGDIVQFRISMDPCGMSYHFAYLYAVPECASAVVEGMSCTEQATTFEVPDGFRYRWYKQNDRNMTTVCTDRFFTPDPTATDSYYVDLINKEDSTCFFTLEAYVLPRRPVPSFTFEQVSEKCQNTLKFDASATRIYEFADSMPPVMVDPAKAKVSHYTWHFGEYGTATGDRPSAVFPNEGGIFPVTLTCEYGGCVVDTTFDVTVAPIPGNLHQVSKTICQGDVFTVNRRDYTAEGVYYDTIVAGSYYGCDSIIEVSLHVIPNIVIDTTVSVTSDQLPYALRIDGKSYTFKRPTDTTIVVASRELRKCDSIDYNVHFLVEAMLEVSLDSLPVICADDPSFTVGYRIDAGYFDTIFVRFSDKMLGVGFDEDAVTYPNGGVTVALPQDTIRPDLYSFDIIFGNGFGVDTLPVMFTAYYPASTVVQRWNDVLAVRNASYNGGYHFVSYQWMQSGAPIPGAVSSNYYVPDGMLDFGAEYYVMLTRADDGVTIPTCPITPRQFTVGESGYADDMTVVFGPAGAAVVSVPQSGAAYIYDVAGVLHLTFPVEAGYNPLPTATLPSGVYLMRIAYSDGSISTRKVVIRSE